MKAIEINGMLVHLCDIKNDEKSFRHAVGGSLEHIKLRDDAMMICDRDAQNSGKAYNALASLIAGTAVYGSALILGYEDGEYCDPPESFVILLTMTE